MRFGGFHSVGRDALTRAAYAVLVGPSPRYRSDMSFEAARAEGLRILREQLGMDDADVGELLDRARETLGAARTEKLVQRIAAAPLTRRSYELAQLTSLIVGTRELGIAWWSADEIQALIEDGSSIAPVGERIWDDVADRRWGAPAGFVDLNSSRSENRLPPWAGGEIGDRRVASFDPGARVDIEIELVRGAMGTRLKIDTCRESPPAETWWAWATVAGLGPHPLPGEEGASDPYAAPLRSEAVTTLRAWALEHAPSETFVREPWRTVGDVVRAWAALGRRDGSWFAWGRAMEALAAGDPAGLEQWLTRLS